MADASEQWQQGQGIESIVLDLDLTHFSKGGSYFDALVSQQVTTCRLDYDGVQIVAVDFDVMSKTGVKHGFNALKRC